MNSNIKIAKELLKIAEELISNGKVFQNTTLHSHISESEGLIISCEMWSGNVFHGKQVVSDYDMAKKEFNQILASISRAIKTATGYKAEVKQNNKHTLGWCFYVQFQGFPSDYDTCIQVVKDVLKKNYDIE